MASAGFWPEKELIRKFTNRVRANAGHALPIHKQPAGLKLTELNCADKK